MRYTYKSMPPMLCKDICEVFLVYSDNRVVNVKSGIAKTIRHFEQHDIQISGNTILDCISKGK